MLLFGSPLENVEIRSDSSSRRVGPSIRLRTRDCIVPSALKRGFMRGLPIQSPGFVGDSATCGAARSRCRHSAKAAENRYAGQEEAGRVAGVGRSVAPRRTEITDVNSLDLDGLTQPFLLFGCGPPPNDKDLRFLAPPYRRTEQVSPARVSTTGPLVGQHLNRLNRRFS
jgi:hypothetical protein